MSPDQNPNANVNPAPQSAQPYPAQPQVAPQLQPQMAPPVVQPAQPFVSPEASPSVQAPIMQPPAAGGFVGGEGMAPTAVSQPVYGSAPMPAGRSTKRWVMLGVAGAVLVVVVVSGLLVFTRLNTVSKGDYRQADTAMIDVADSYNKIGEVSPSSTETATEIANDSQKLGQARTTFDTKFAQLGKLKAIKHDKDLKAEYQAVAQQQPKFEAAMDATMEAYAKIMPVVSTYSQTSLSGGDLTTQINSLQKDFASISGLKDENNKAFVANMTSLLSKYATLAVKVQAGRNDYKQYDSQAVKDFYDTDTQISNAMQDWQSNLTKLADQGDLQQNLQKLQDTLTSKAIG